MEKLCWIVSHALILTWNTSVSKIIVRNNFPCLCHDCQSELRINMFMLFSHLLEAMTSEVLSELPSTSFQVPVHLSNSRWVLIYKVWTEWLLEGSHSDRTWLDRSHRASNYYWLQTTTKFSAPMSFNFFSVQNMGHNQLKTCSKYHFYEFNGWEIPFLTN